VEEEPVKRYITFTAAILMLLMSAVGGTHAEVKTIQMKIAGYLCGN
jgi:hypothetical protein